MMRAWLAVVLMSVIVAACTTESHTHHRGGIGESCQARNDCAPKLACVRGGCVPEDIGFGATGKECYRVECAEKADCCAGFVPDPNCSDYEAACDADSGQCLPYLTLCQCNAACEDSLCFDRGPSCTLDDHCIFATTPFCTSGQCAECREHTDCGSGGTRCIEGLCEGPCADDAECPLFHTCEGGSCMETGCSSDRECAFLLGDSRASCSAAKVCQIGCDTSLECDDTRFEVCQGGRCVFAGCQSDAECRVVLGLENEPKGVRAQCR